MYIILARRTREGAYQQVFALLQKRFRRWDNLLDAPRRKVKKLVYSGGLSRKKTLALRAALAALRKRSGKCTLEPARSWSDEELETFLHGLPEFERKSAYCIMMYSFGRLPADKHAGRVLARLGPYRELGLTLDGFDHKKLQTILADVIPPNLRYSLHVNLVQHGRSVCRSVLPLCEKCGLRNLCQYYRRQETKRVMGGDAPTVINFFAGSGGLSEGFVKAGLAGKRYTERRRMFLAKTWRPT